MKSGGVIVPNQTLTVICSVEYQTKPQSVGLYTKRALAVICSFKYQTKHKLQSGGVIVPNQNLSDICSFKYQTKHKLKIWRSDYIKPIPDYHL
jgi:hypothetical protein